MWRLCLRKNPGAVPAQRQQLSSPFAVSSREEEVSMAHAESAKRTLRILLVDDEEALRRSTRRLLEGDGHIVFEAHDGLDALRIIRKEAVDIVITDLNMPDMNGPDL